jgi:hypothetical protein
MRRHKTKAATPAVSAPITDPPTAATMIQSFDDDSFPLPDSHTVMDRLAGSQTHKANRCAAARAKEADLAGYGPATKDRVLPSMIRKRSLQCADLECISQALMVAEQGCGHDGREEESAGDKDYNCKGNGDGWAEAITEEARVVKERPSACGRPGKGPSTVDSQPHDSS